MKKEAGENSIAKNHNNRMKNLLDGFNIKFDTAEDRISET